MRAPGRPWRRLLRSILLAMIVVVDIACGRVSEPTLAGLDGLLAAKQYDEAERRLSEFLSARPDDAQANLLSAQVALNREPQLPDLALKRLGQIPARKVGHATLAIVRLNEGKAYSVLGDNVKAEAAWFDALHHDSLVPEAGWALLSLYYVEGRRDEAERLGLALHDHEPDPRDRVQLLLELIRQDAKPIVPFEIIRVLEPIAREHPNDPRAAVALARAYYGASRYNECLDLLKNLLERYPDSPAIWDALLRSLDDAARPEEFAETLSRLPRTFIDQPRFARHEGVAAQNRRDWSSSVKSLELARAFDPLDSQIVYRLGRAYRLTGREADATKLESEFRDVSAALNEMLPLYREANAIRGFGAVPSPDLFLRIASARERLGYRAEALAWFRLALRDRPQDADAQAAAQRLSDVKLPKLAEVLESARTEQGTPSR